MAKNSIQYNPRMVRLADIFCALVSLILQDYSPGPGETIKCLDCPNEEIMSNVDK